MPQCTAANCSNRPGKAFPKGRSFHKLPHRKPDLLKVWLAQMGRGESWQPTVHAVICSDHFEESCVDRTGQITRLWNDAVPTLFQSRPHPRVEEQKSNVIKFPFKLLRSGKHLNASDTGGPSHDHNYVIHQEKTGSDSERRLTDRESRTGPSRDWRSYDQDSFLHEEQTTFASSASVNGERQIPVVVESPINLSQEGQTDNQVSPHQDQNKANNDRPLQDSDNQMVTLPLPDRHGNIFYPRKRAQINVDALTRKRRRINKVKQHDHTYSIGDNPVVLKLRMDTALTKMAEIRSKLKTSQRKNRRLSIKVHALTRDVEELRDRQFVIKRTLKFLEALDYRPKFDSLFQSK